MRGFVRCIALVGAALAAAAASAQIPDEFRNLQVLDPEIDRGELISIMRSFSGDLGVRCTHCHGGRDDLQGTDFASDALATKRTAREMLKMVRAIETGHLAALPVVAEAEGKRRAHVTCYTCHRGMEVPPRETTELLAEVVEEKGAEAVAESFAALRAEHADAGRYDLRAVVLFRLARQRMEQDDLDGALVLLDGLHEVDPDMGDGHALRAQVQIARGDLEAAERALAKAREVEPEARLADWVEGLLARAKEEEAPRDE